MQMVGLSKRRLKKLKRKWIHTNILFLYSKIQKLALLGTLIFKTRKAHRTLKWRRIKWRSRRKIHNFTRQNWSHKTSQRWRVYWNWKNIQAMVRIRKTFNKWKKNWTSFEISKFQKYASLEAPEKLLELPPSDKLYKHLQQKQSNPQRRNLALSFW